MENRMLIFVENRYTENGTTYALLFCTYCQTCSIKAKGSIRNCKSCGCMRYKFMAESNSKYEKPTRKMPEYRLWNAMKERCGNKNVKCYKSYGARGIEICPRWKNSFQNFYEDMGPRPSLKLSIERRNNDGNYEPGNCYWGTRREQANNKTVSHYIEYNGKRQTIAEWAREMKIDYHALFWRIQNNWDIKKALTTPSRKNL